MSDVNIDPFAVAVPAAATGVAMGGVHGGSDQTDRLRLQILEPFKQRKLLKICDTVHLRKYLAITVRLLLHLTLPFLDFPKCFGFSFL